MSREGAGDLCGEEYLTDPICVIIMYNLVVPRLQDPGWEVASATLQHNDSPCPVRLSGGSYEAFVLREVLQSHCRQATAFAIQSWMKAFVASDTAIARQSSTHVHSML